MSDVPNPPAFPNNGFDGMTLRDWFAGQALAVMNAAPDYSKGPCNAAIAERAYVIANAMLAERAKLQEAKP